jgi:hypothetical protein
MHAVKELTTRYFDNRAEAGFSMKPGAKKQKNNREAENQEPLMVLRVEYLSDGGEEGFPWLH